MSVRLCQPHRLAADSLGASPAERPGVTPPVRPPRGAEGTAGAGTCPPLTPAPVRGGSPHTPGLALPSDGQQWSCPARVWRWLAPAKTSLFLHPK